MAKKTPAKLKQDMPETKRAKLAHKHAKSSMNNFYSAFESLRFARKATGAPTDGEQDLLRAGVVFAAGGLDITVKELIRGSLKRLAASDEDVQEGFEKFARKRLRTDLEGGGKSEPARFLAELLVSGSPYDKLIESYIFDLTGSSLQSADELFKAAAALDIDNRFLIDCKTELGLAFHVRNNIIHELDVNFEGGRGQRQRKSRTKPVLEEHSKLLIDVADHFIKEVESKIKTCS